MPKLPPQEFIAELNRRVHRDEVYRQLESKAEARLVPHSRSPGGYDIFEGTRMVAAEPMGRTIIGIFSEHYQHMKAEGLV